MCRFPRWLIAAGAIPRGRSAIRLNRVTAPPKVTGARILPPTQVPGCLARRCLSPAPSPDGASPASTHLPRLRARRGPMFHLCFTALEPADLPWFRITHGRTKKHPNALSLPARSMTKNLRTHSARCRWGGAQLRRRRAPCARLVKIEYENRQPNNRP